MAKPEKRGFRTNGNETLLPTEFWIVVFTDYISTGQYKVYHRVGTLINAVESHFGWKRLVGLYPPGKVKLPEYHVWRVDLEAGTVHPVEGPLWRT